MKTKAACDGVEFRIYEEEEFDKEFNRKLVQRKREAVPQEVRGQGLPPCRYRVEVYADRGDLFWEGSTEEWTCSFYCATLPGAKRVAIDEMHMFYERHPELDKKVLVWVEQ